MKETRSNIEFLMQIQKTTVGQAAGLTRKGWIPYGTICLTLALHPA